MRRLAALAGLLLFAAPSLAQTQSSVYTEPVLPSSRDLDRLNLTMAWKAYVPMDARSDGIATMQLIDNQIYVQTRSNLLIVYSAATGEESWRVRLPKRNLPSFPVAVNHFDVLVVNGPNFFILDRRNGKLKYTIDLPSTVAAGLAADIEQCFVVLSSNRVISVGLQPEDVRYGQRVRAKVEGPEAPTGMSLNIQSV
ncbi:MAG: PQQ-like beta-propeller repeat protein, partial [Planctomycetes bacterium]|nr:PQQ-like beta-propeller repeat protein [Planctomycetota bacterium]